jgi:hypothetical protein
MNIFLSNAITDQLVDDRRHSLEQAAARPRWSRRSRHVAASIRTRHRPPPDAAHGPASAMFE